MTRRLPRSVPELAAQLTDLGVRSGDVVMPHVSMRKVGGVVGGAAGLVAAIDAAVGPTGTVLVNVGIENGFAAVHQAPTDRQRAMLEALDPVDPLTAPPDPDNGVFAAVFSALPGTVLTDHPEGRLAARGARSTELTADQPWDDYYGIGSPLDRFAAMDGRVLRLGADRDTTTLIHLAEALAAVPHKRIARRWVKVATTDGPTLRLVTTFDDSDGIADFPGDEDEFATILDEYLSTGRAGTGPVGDAHAELIEGPDLVRVAARWSRPTPPIRAADGLMA